MPIMQKPPGYQGNGQEVMLNPWMAMIPAEEAVKGLEGPLGYVNEFVPWKGAKDLMAKGRNALNALKGYFGGGAQEAETAAPAIPKQSLRTRRPEFNVVDDVVGPNMRRGLGMATADTMEHVEPPLPTPGAPDLGRMMPPQAPSDWWVNAIRGDNTLPGKQLGAGVMEGLYNARRR